MVTTKPMESTTNKPTEITESEVSTNDFTTKEDFTLTSMCQVSNQFNIQIPPNGATLKSFVIVFYLYVFIIYMYLIT